MIIVARHDKTGVIELPLGDVTMYGTGGEDRVLMNACTHYGPEWTLSLYAPCGDQRSGIGAGEFDAEAFADAQCIAKAVAHIENHPPFVSGVDLANGPDRAALWVPEIGEVAIPEFPPYNTAELRWFDGRLEQKWIVYMAGHSTEEWRPVPAYHTAHGDKA